MTWSHYLGEYKFYMTPAKMVGPTIIHHNKSANTLESAMRCTAKKCDLENKSETYIITDDVPGLIAARLKSFSKCSLLKCTFRS